MARWEALCLLIAIKTWSKVLSTSSGSLVVMGDALGMLHGASKFKARDPGLNLLFMEMALIFAPQGSTIEALHMWSEENALADVLSRITDDSLALPAILSKVPRTPCRATGFHVLGRGDARGACHILSRARLCQPDRAGQTSGGPRG
jgi:hypothetical protein